MKIEIINDGKEKEMSFEAHLQNADVSKFMYTGRVDATGYGENEAEARENLKKALDEITEMLGHRSFDADTFATSVREAICVGPMSEFPSRMNIIWQKYFNKNWVQE